MDVDFLNTYLEHRKRIGTQAQGLKTRKYNVRLFLRWLASKRIPLTDVTPSILNEHLFFRKSSGYRPSTLKHALLALRDFFRHVRGQGLNIDDPVKNVSLAWIDIPGGYPAYHGALKKIIHQPGNMLRFRLPLLAPYWEQYLERLLERGYRRSSLQLIMKNLSRFHDFLHLKKITSVDRITPELVEGFLRHCKVGPQDYGGHPLTARTLQRLRGHVETFLGFAFDQNNRQFRRPPTLADSIVLSNKLLNGYLDFASTHRGLKPKTINDHGRELLLLRSFLERRSIRRISSVSAIDLDAYLMYRARKMSTRGLKSVVTDLRSFFRYLYINGNITYDLARDILSPRRFSDDLRPKYLPWHKIRELLGGIDRRDLLGKRDYAILTLLAYHGLRAGEAAGLRLSEIDWENHALLLRKRKDGSSVQIPLSQETEKALKDYLTVRPACPYPEIFLSVRAPMKPLGTSLRLVARKYLSRYFGHAPHNRGAHIFRHSFAKALLDRGAKLPEIGTLLGHKRLQSTLIYTRIATRDLMEVADNYAGLL